MGFWGVLDFWSEPKLVVIDIAEPYIEGSFVVGANEEEKNNLWLSVE